ncbi:H-NS histone family protein [Trinickia violacea]|uniref:H-NS histone family protein n=1 Tax=Trinickia violacea TaxID=2571746 RepID=A0A4P8J0C6_9BURK|nr:H-NS histone family protein [Trinickia violacea]QCP54361.1 H-NS histone family protein [Trinickia violacea]
MNSYFSLLKQFDQLQREIEIARVREVRRFIDEVFELLNERGVSLDDLVEYRMAVETHQSRGAKVKYRDSATGRTWSGRGREPDWIRGKDRNDFLIE